MGNPLPIGAFGTLVPIQMLHSIIAGNIGKGIDVSFADSTTPRYSFLTNLVVLEAAKFRSTVNGFIDEITELGPLTSKEKVRAN